VSGTERCDTLEVPWWRAIVFVAKRKSFLVAQGNQGKRKDQEIESNTVVTGIAGSRGVFIGSGTLQLCVRGGLTLEWVNAAINNPALRNLEPLEGDAALVAHQLLKINVQHFLRLLKNVALVGQSLRQGEEPGLRSHFLQKKGKNCVVGG
jgi:hypothetical protein